jgi:DNA-binding CsgD family transcriptional regulator
VGFVGREPERAVLADCLDAALAGRPRLVLCRGEPGIGKTRLAEELSALARARGLAVVWGAPPAAAGAPPYWPWRLVLRGLAGQYDLAAVADQQRLTADLAQLAPEVFPGPASGPDGTGDAQFRLFDAVARLLARVAASRPLLVVLDDTHWADPSSLLLLRHVTQTLLHQQLLVVVNHRDTEPLPSVLVVDLPREPVTRQLVLRGLTVPEVGEQLASLGATDVAAADLERVHARTGGNPFFIGEVGRRITEGRSALPVTATLRAAIGARLQRLSEPARHLMEAASVVGRDVPVVLLARVLQRPVFACLSLLDEAAGAGLLTATASPGEHRFSHDLVRDAVEAGLDTTERVRLHRRTAAAIEEVYAGQIDVHLSDLARHWTVAAVTGGRARAADWIARAAEEAVRRLAYEEAARLYRLALDVGAPDVADVDRCRLLLALGGALKLAGELPVRVEACREAAGIARRLGRPDLLAEAAVALEGGESDVESELALRRLCEEALAALPPEPTKVRAQVAANLSDACMYLGDVDAAGPASEQALEVADRCGDPAAVVAALRARQLVCTGPDGVAERARLADRMLAVGRDTADPVAQMWAHLWRIDVAFQRGDLAAVARELEPLGWCTEEVRGPLARWHLRQCQAVLAQAQARFGDARVLADQACTAMSSTATGYDSAMTNRAAVLSMAELHTGEVVELTGLLRAGPPDQPELPTAGVIFSIAAARMLVARGQLTEAATVYRRLGPPAAWRSIPHAATVCYALGIRTAVALGAFDDVAVLHARLDRFRGQHGASGAGATAYNGPLELYLGVAAAALGRYDGAVEDLEAAARACAANGAAGFHVEARYELAATLARRASGGDLRRARALALDVAKQAVALGMRPWEAAARALADRLPERVDLLTSREHEVATLVAQGLTNREIAARLYLSERTAQNHVQHILTKLDLPNRSSIAIWVTRAMSTAAE